MSGIDGNSGPFPWPFKGPDGLNLDERVQNHCLRLLTQLEEAEIGERRYEYLRKLTPHQFQELWMRNLNGEGRFDDLVDAAIRNQEGA